MANKFKIKIGDNTYTINTEENEDYVKKLSDELNLRLKAVSAKNPTLSQAMISALVSMQLCDEAIKLREQCNNYELQIKLLRENSGMASNEAINAKREIERLSREIRELKRESDKK